MVNSVYYARREVLAAQHNLDAAKARLRAIEAERPWNKVDTFSCVVLGIAIGLTIVSLFVEDTSF